MMRRRIGFVCLLVLALSTIGWSDAAGEGRSVDERRAAPEVDNVRIENIAGRVTVLGWDKDTIHVEGTLGEDVEELVFNVSGNNADIRVRVARRHARKIRTVLTIHVPRRCGVYVETVSADVAIESLNGDAIKVKTVSGGVDVRACPGDLDVNTTSGGIDIEDARNEVDAETVSGSIDISGAPLRVRANAVSGSIKIDGVRENVEAETVSGSVKIDAETVGEVDVETVSGGVEFRGALAEDADVEVNTLSGGVRVHFTEELSGEFRLKSFSGSIDADFGPDVSGAPHSFTSKEIRFTLGDGDARIDIESFSGSIRIRM